jgi:hypothetical protein
MDVESRQSSAIEAAPHQAEPTTWIPVQAQGRPWIEPVTTAA